MGSKYGFFVEISQKKPGKFVKYYFYDTCKNEFICMVQLYGFLIRITKFKKKHIKTWKFNKNEFICMIQLCGFLIKIKKLKKT